VADIQIAAEAASPSTELHLTGSVRRWSDFTDPFFRGLHRYAGLG
jgi:hypothetical protein